MTWMEFSNSYIILIYYIFFHIFYKDILLSCHLSVIILPLIMFYLCQSIFISIAHGTSKSATWISRRDKHTYSTSSGSWVQNGGQSISFPILKRVPIVELPWLGGLLPWMSSVIILWVVALLEKNSKFAKPVKIGSMIAVLLNNKRN